MENFFSQFPEVNFQKDDILIRPDEEITHIYFLKSGKVKMYSISPEGEEVTLHIFNEKSYIPIMLALSTNSSQYYFQAVEDVLTQKAPVTKVQEFLKNNSDELYELATRFSFAIAGLSKRIQTLAFEDAYHKVLNLLQYFAQKNDEEIPLTHEEIASWLGLKRETVSRQIEKLQKDGRLTYYNKKLRVTKITE